jgi:class 3 adenylate cyclase
MSWNYDRSKQLVEEHAASMGKITVEKLKKEADLETLLSETNCRQIFGAHLYFDISNFSALASAATDSKDEMRRLVQGVHIYQREVTRIVESADIFDAVRVHFQGPKLHALIYRPIDDGERLASLAVLLALVLQDFTRSVFNPAFPKLGNFRVASGSDIGDVIGTQNGVKGDRELLFVGHPANHAAKISGPLGTHRLTRAVYDLLPNTLRDVCELVPDDDRGLYQIKKLTCDELDALCSEFDIGWNRDASAERVEDDRKQFPLSEIEIGDADTLIDMDLLSIRNNRRVGAASIFADLCGFTSYIDAADTPEKQEEALRVLHVVRKEFTKVATCDFNGVRVQFQGDRIQIFFHLPKSRENKIIRKAVDAAAGIQSSMDVIKECMPEAKNLSVAVGIDYGTTLVSKLGTRGARDRICLGDAVEQAAKIEERVEGTDTGIAAAAHVQLAEDIGSLFQWKKELQCFVARNLTADVLERADESAQMKEQKTASVSRSAAGIAVSVGTALGRSVPLSRNYAE